MRNANGQLRWRLGDEEKMRRDEEKQKEWCMYMCVCVWRIGMNPCILYVTDKCLCTIETEYLSCISAAIEEKRICVRLQISNCENLHRLLENVRSTISASEFQAWAWAHIACVYKINGCRQRRQMQARERKIQKKKAWNETTHSAKHTKK